MEFIPANCPNCGGQLQLPKGRETALCMYCGNNILIPQAIVKTAEGNAINWMQLAKTAEAGSNNHEAYGFYTKILEVDSSNYEAWLGRARTAGWTSTLAQIRISEVLSSMEKAIECAPKEKIDETREYCASTLHRLVYNIYMMARKHLVEFAALDKTWSEYLENCCSLIDALERAHTYDPRNASVVDYIIFLCKDNIEGFPYRDRNNVYNVHEITSQYEESLRAKMGFYVAKAQALNPDYFAPEIKRPRSPCFVATATMGDSGQAEVEILRQFNNQVLKRSLLGRGFIWIYWRVGPTLARFIDKSALLRTLVRIAIVNPAASFAKHVVKESTDTRCGEKRF